MAVIPDFSGEAIILDRVPFSALIIDDSLRVVWVNRKWLEKTGRDFNEILRVRVTELFPEPMVDYMSLESNLRFVFRTKEIFTGEPLTYRAPGISTRTYAYTIRLLNAGIWKSHAFLMLEDITEKMQLIEKARSVSRHLANVVEHAHDLIISADSKSRIITWNPSAERLSGFPEAQVQGRPLTDLFEGRDEKLNEILVRLNRLEVVRDEELNLKSRSGKNVPISWSFSPISEENGRVVAIVAIGRDLSERRAFEMQLFQAEKLASLGVMAGGIAHEIRNPLAICFSSAQFLDAELGDPEQRTTVKKMISAILRASDIIESLLRFAKPTDANAPCPVNLVDAARETVKLIASKLTLHNISIVEDYPEPCLTVVGNANLLQQVVMNLVMNAQQSMPEGGSLSITVIRHGREALMRIQDTGCGITPGMIGRIFDPFFTTRTGGTGLGLSVCYAIVKQHMGSIEVESTEGMGSLFSVRLPLRNEN